MPEYLPTHALIPDALLVDRNLFRDGVNVDYARRETSLEFLGQVLRDGLFRV